MKIGKNSKNFTLTASRKARTMEAVKLLLPRLAEKIETRGALGPEDLDELVNFLMETLEYRMDSKVMESYVDEPFKLVALLVADDGSEPPKPILAGAASRERALEMVDFMKEASLQTLGRSPKNLSWRVVVKVYDHNFNPIPDLGFNKSVLDLLV